MPKEDNQSFPIINEIGATEAENVNILCKRSAILEKKSKYSL